MRTITKNMIEEFKIDKLGFDFMGYTFQRLEELSFHHLIISKRLSKESGIGKGFLFWNGAILTQSTAHEYLHIIEKKDPEIFSMITSEMIDENTLKRIELSNLRRIRDLLLAFEKDHIGETTKNGVYIIKPSYIEKRISLK